MNPKYAILFRPKPTDNDYQNGYIIRYFAKQRNNVASSIVEIDSKQYNAWISRLGNGLSYSFYDVIAFRWKISGTREDLTNSNFKILSLMENKMTGIRSKLGNLLEFHR